MRRLVSMFMVTVMLSLGTAILPVSAQMELHTLMYSSTGIIRELDGTGHIVDSVQLPIPDGYYNFSYNLDFDPTGRYVAYTVSNLQLNRTRFRVYGYEDAKLYVDYAIDLDADHSFMYRANNVQLFNHSGQVVFSFTPHWNNVPSYQWNILIFDVNTAEVVHSLNWAEFPFSLPAGQLIPVPHVLEDHQLTFGFTSQAFGANWSYDTYVFDFASGAITKADFDRSQGFDQHGDTIVTPQQAQDLPVSHGFFPNYLSMQSGRQDSQLLYAHPSLSFREVFFVQNGTRLLAHAVTPTHVDQWLLFGLDDQPPLMYPLERRLDFVETSDDGFFYSEYDSPLRQNSYLYHVNTVDNPLHPTLIASGVPGHLVGLHTAPGNAEVTVKPKFRVGDVVVITQEGNQLRMRLTPGGEVQRQFNAGSIVTIVGGPTEFTRTLWWRVRDENGLVGWIAQGNDEVSYLALAQ